MNFTKENILKAIQTIDENPLSHFCQRTFNNNRHDTNIMLKNMFNILHLLKVKFISLTN